MKHGRWARPSTALLGVLILGAALGVVLWRPRPVLGPEPADGFVRVRGVVHVHTTLSDGGGTPEEVATAAHRAGLAFVAITDHNNLDAKPFEGYHDGVLVLVGTEISTASSGHILVLGPREDPAFRFSGDPVDALDDVRVLGGAAFVAHPLSPRSDFRWTEWDLPGPWGLELLNGDSQWRASGVWRLARTLALYPLNPRYALLTSLTSPQATLAQWDRLLASRAAPGLTGADAHSRILVAKDWGLRFPSYESVFGLAVNYVLLNHPLSGRVDADGREIVDALSRGRSYVGLDALAPAGGFFFTAEAEGRLATMGDVLPLAPTPRLRAGGRLPRGARLRLLRDGVSVSEAEGVIDQPASGPGVYRVEVRVPGWEIPWVLSNPISVFAPEVTEARARRANWPEPLPAPESALVLENFDGPTSSFQPASVPTDAIQQPILIARKGIDGSGAARLRFRLDPPTAAQPNPFCALVDWSHRDLRGRNGLVFSIRADGIYRLWVQVRDENPASTDEGMESWFASVRTAHEWRRVGMPFARLRSVNPHSHGRLDLERIRALVFLIDRGGVKPGTHGTIWLDDIGAY